MRKSLNHLCFRSDFEYFHGSKYIFQSDIRDPIECTGRRECTEIVTGANDWNRTEIGRKYPVVPEGWKSI